MLPVRAERELLPAADGRLLRVDGELRAGAGQVLSQGRADVRRQLLLPGRRRVLQRRPDGVQARADVLRPGLLRARQDVLRRQGVLQLRRDVLSGGL